ncbi:MAG: hydrogenase maturation protease [Candidatus Hermodarchaeota archaeon]
MLEKLLDQLSGAKRVVFMGIGEEKLSDDGVGLYIIAELLNYTNEKFLFINAGIDPMIRIDEVIDFDPSHLVLIDTCTLESSPGTVAILERENICDYVPISTHTIPIHIVIDLIAEKIKNPDFKVFMIGIVPESLDGFSELSFYKEGELTIQDKIDNENLPFFEIQLTRTIQKVADELIIVIKELIQRL